MRKQIMSRETQTDALNKKAVLARLGTSMFATNVILHNSIDSTNRYARDMAGKGAPEGTLVLAEEQTAGKGRMERRWLSKGYSNLLFSVLLRPSLTVDKVFVLTMIMAIATIEAVKVMKSLNTMIKWPNDLYIGQRKLGGILTEFSVRDGVVGHVILGIGLNVNWNPGEDHGLLYPATSIFAESGSRVSRNELLAGILKEFEGYYKEVLTGRTEDLYRRWNELSLIMGKEVNIESNGEKIRGMALRIDHQGALIIRDGRGKERKVLSGDISLTI
ncbi:biotin--[acetyl-CoA-carboxylase] ligase [Thermodesulfobacteriota bacterium]